MTSESRIFLIAHEHNRRLPPKYILVRIHHDEYKRWVDTRTRLQAPDAFIGVPFSFGGLLQDNLVSALLSSSAYQILERQQHLELEGPLASVLTDAHPVWNVQYAFVWKGFVTFGTLSNHSAVLEWDVLDDWEAA